MSKRDQLLIAFLAVSLLVCSCMHLESSRTVTIDRAKSEVFIEKKGRFTGLTAEGAFPEWSQSARLMASQAIPEGGVFVLDIPRDATAQYGAVTSGVVRIDLDRKRATVRLKPSDTYYWLTMLDGDYPVIMK